MVNPRGQNLRSPVPDAVFPISARPVLAAVIIAVLLILPAGAVNTTATATQTTSAVVPDASFSANTSSGAAPLTVYFTDQSSGDLASWAWSFGDGQSATTQNPTHTYTDPGSYSVTLTVTSRAGLTDTYFESEYITVEDADAVTTTTTTEVTTTVTTATTVTAAFSATPVSGGSPLNVTFTESSTGDIDTYKWDFGDGQQSKTRNPSHVYTVPGKYSVWLTVTGDAGTDVEKKQDYITVTDVTATVTTAATAGSSDMILYIETPGATKTTTAATRTPTSRPATATATSHATTAVAAASSPPPGGSGLLLPVVIVVIIGAVIGAGFLLYRRRYEDELA